MASGWDFLSGFAGTIDENIKARDKAARELELQKKLLQLRAETELDLHKNKNAYDRANVFNREVVNADGTVSYQNANGEFQTNAKGERVVIADAKVAQTLRKGEADIRYTNSSIDLANKKFELDKAQTHNQMKNDNARTAHYTSKEKDSDVVVSGDAVFRGLVELNKGRIDEIKGAAKEGEGTINDAWLRHGVRAAEKYAARQGLDPTKPSDKKKYMFEVESFFGRYLDQASKRAFPDASAAPPKVNR